MVTSRRASVLLAATLFVCAPGRARCERDAPPADDGRSTAGGRLGWLFSDDLDLVGDLWARLPFLATDGGSAYGAIEARTAIRKATSLTFDVRDLEYTIEAGGRRALSAPWSWTAFAGQRGLERADADGSFFVRYVGGGVERAGSEPAVGRSALDGSASAGLVVDDRDVDAQAVASARVRWTHRKERVAYGAELRVDALVGGDDSGADLEVGPRIDLFVGGPPVASFFLHYVRARSPLGLQTTGALLGFEYASGGERLRDRKPPDVRGALDAGGGDGGRASARFDLLVTSPTFSSLGTRVVGEVDLHVLTGEDADQLYYVYRVGIAADAWRGVAGGQFRHRSNHRLSETGTGVTSMNVVEVGWETPGWSDPPEATPGARWGTLEGSVRAGVLLDTSFGDSGDLHGSAGIRWNLPARSRSLAPFVLLEAEEGGASLRRYEAGVALPAATEIALGYRSDEQWFGADRTVVLLTAAVRF